MCSERGELLTGYFPGTFDFLHPGHLVALEYASTRCRELVVMLQVNAGVVRPDKAVPVLSVSERCDMVMATRFVSRVVPYVTEEELCSYLAVHSPCVRFLGDDWKNREFSGSDIEGVVNLFVPRVHKLSSSILRGRVFDVRGDKRGVPCSLPGGPMRCPTLSHDFDDCPRRRDE